MIIESPHELGFRFDQQYSIATNEFVRLKEVKREGKNFVYQFQQIRN